MISLASKQEIQEAQASIAERSYEEWKAGVACPMNQRIFDTLNLFVGEPIWLACKDVFPFHYKVWNERRVQ